MTPLQTSAIVILTFITQERLEVSKKTYKISSIVFTTLSEIHCYILQAIYTEFYSLGPSRVYSQAFSTYKYATTNKMLHGGADNSSSPLSAHATRLTKPGLGSSYENNVTMPGDVR